MSTPEQPEAASAPITLFAEVDACECSFDPTSDGPIVCEERRTGKMQAERCKNFRYATDAEILAQPEATALRKRAEIAEAAITRYGDDGAMRALRDANERAEKAEAALANKSAFTVRAVERIYELTAALAERDAAQPQKAAP